MTQHSVPALQLSSAPDQPEPDSRQVEPHAEEASSEDELPLPEKPMSRRAARELGDLIEGLPETATSNRRRRQPVPFTDDWQSSKPPPLKKRKRSETPEDGVLLPCHTAAPAKAAKAPAAKAPTPKNASTGTAKASKAARAEAAALQHDESSQEDDRGWKLSDSKARELGDLMSGQQWDCSLPRGRRPPPGPSLPAALPSSLETVSKLKASAAQKDSTGKAPKASKAGISSACFLQALAASQGQSFSGSLVPISRSWSHSGSSTQLTPALQPACLGNTVCLVFTVTLLSLMTNKNHPCGPRMALLRDISLYRQGQEEAEGPGKAC